MSKPNEKYALVSVYDKTGVVFLAQKLIELGYKIISTGGTAKELTANKVPVIQIEKITGNPESFDGRMKTISFQIESGILFDRSNPTHVREAAKLGIKPIDIVVCNFYPFEVKNSVENIDIGGPTMVRAAAKNFGSVITLIDPKDYEPVIKLLQENKVDEEVRRNLAAKVFEETAYYDSLVTRFLKKETFPEKLTVPLKLKSILRYGENPHQKAAFYIDPYAHSPMTNLTNLYGRGLSLVNVTDVNSGIDSVRFFKEPAAVVIKHNSPCGIALGRKPAEALRRAIAADPQSAFGGVIVLNKKLDVETASVIADFKSVSKSNIDIIAAPSVQNKVLTVLPKVRKSMGIYSFGSIGRYRPVVNGKWINGGLILQESDESVEKSFSKWETVTRKKPTQKQLEQMKIGWKFIGRIRSNTILVIDRNLPMTRGIGSGQTSRIRSSEIALSQAGKYAQGAILVSDSFFPFDDSVKLAQKHKIAVILQQGGSVNDKLSIEAANDAGIAMVFTHRRAFWH